MKIGFVGPVPPYKGGIAQHSSAVVRTLRKQGHDVDAISWATQYPARLYPGEQRDRHAASFPGASFSLRWWDPLSWIRAGRSMRRHDLLIFSWVTPIQGIPLETIVRTAGIPAVAIVHNPLPHERRWFDEPVTRRVMRRAAGAIVHAEPARAELHRLAPHLSARVVPMPPLLTLRSSDLPPAPPYRLLFVGIVRPYKGLDVALAALGELRAHGTDATLTVAGEFWEPVERWRDSIARQGLDQAVDLRPGYVPDAEMQQLFDTHHLVVAPYRSSTQSAIVPLAYAAGRPVVATRVGGLAECVVDGATGTLSPPNDPQAFAAAIQRAIDDLRALADRAATSAPSWEDVTAAILSAAGRG